MSLFVIADVTSPKSTPSELEATARQFKIPFLPIIDRALEKHNELRAQKAQEPKTLTVDDLLKGKLE